ncbi:MAG: phosphoribosylglycinamide formyltransferase [SAR324 cluster bacterium]|nr:phosphoribosylglycinamide formyltransferase [SAR324 cluster bacterium]MBL7034774.1 phosphoribosylglycinamide formyltransferase [SAR324 cluster bacterium]
MRIAVFASGQGSNFLAIHAAVVAGKLAGVSLDLLICDRPEAPVVEEVKKRGIPYFVFNPRDYPDKNAFETVINKKLDAAKIELVVLAGYMRLVGPVLLEEWEGRMLNLHPSLLPKFPGKDAIGQAWRAGAKETGVTVHFVDAGMDTGRIFLQQKVIVEAHDTVEILSEKIHQLEHQLLPEAIQKFQQEI